jgi:hypothetical protein
MHGKTTIKNISGLGRAEDNCLTTGIGIIDKKPFYSHCVECRIRIMNEQLSGFLDHKDTNKFKAIETKMT